jgi:hypothetical protein
VPWPSQHFRRYYNMSIIEDDKTIQAKSAHRRKFTSEQDLMPLNEVFAVGAHVPKHGETVLKFGAVADKLNSSGYLPWTTDPKDVQDRFKLLMANWIRRVRANTQASSMAPKLNVVPIMSCLLCFSNVTSEIICCSSMRTTA